MVQESSILNNHLWKKTQPSSNSIKTSKDKALEGNTIPQGRITPKGISIQRQEWRYKIRLEVK